MKHNKIIVLAATAMVCLSATAQKLETIYKSLPQLDKVQMMDLEKNELAAEKYDAAVEQVQEDMMAIANLTVEASTAIQSMAGKTQRAVTPQMSAMSAELLKELQKRGVSLDQLSNMSEEELMKLMMPIIQQMNGGVTVDDEDDEGEISAADSKILDRLSEISENINNILMETVLKCASDDCEHRYEQLEGEYDEMWIPYEERIVGIRKELDSRVDGDAKDGNAIPTPAYARGYFDKMNQEVKAYNALAVEKWNGKVDPEIEAVKKVLDQAMSLYAEWFKLRETLSTENTRKMAGTSSGFTSIHVVAQYYIKLLKVKAEVPVHGIYQVPEMIGGLG